MATPSLARDALTRLEAQTYLDYIEEEAPIASGNVVHMHPPGLFTTRGVLTKLEFYSIKVPASGESMKVQLFRFRRLTPTGPFIGPTLMNDPVTFTSANTIGAFSNNISSISD